MTANTAAGPNTPSASNGLGVSLNLPKGGGALRGMGEKFAANPATGTGKLSIPIATGPGGFWAPVVAGL